MFNDRTERDRAPISAPDLDDYRRDAATLSGLAAFTNWNANLTGDGAPERLEGVRIAGNFCQLLGVVPLAGRGLLPADEQQQSHVAILTHGLWSRRFGSDLSMVGRHILLNGEAFEVVGILPPRFLFPFRDAELAVPLTLASDPRRADRGANFLRVIARLAPGVSVREAKANLDAIAHRLQQQYPDDDARKTGLSLYPLHGEIVRDYRTVLWTLLGAVSLLLTVGCINLATLLLVGATSRRTEFLVRLSLGASPSRLARQLLAESAILAVTGGALGTALADAGLRAVRLWDPGDIPLASYVGIDWRVTALAFGLSTLAAVACGLIPVLFVSRHSDLLVGTARTSTSDRRQVRGQRTLVVIEAALASVLLVAMGLVAKNLRQLQRVDPGFLADRALSMQLSLPPTQYATRDALVRFADALSARVLAIPGIDHAGAVSLLPLSGLLSVVDIALPGEPPPSPQEVPQAHLRVVTPDYFAAAGIRFVEGRAFTDQDRENGLPVAIVSRTLAARHWPGQRAVGHALEIVMASQPPRLQVVGVVDDVKQAGLEANPTADLYVPLRQMPASQAPLLASRQYWVIRGRHAPAMLAQSLGNAVRQVDAGVAASNARTLEQVWSASLASRRISVRLLEAFSESALALCAIGVYGVASFAARARRRELAIRAAVGATDARLICAMLRRELEPVVIGLAIGLVSALLIAPSFARTLAGPNPRDLATFVGVACVLLAVAATASYVPVRKAARANPAEVLQT
jgi:putative ABC transport system permease protein